MNLCVLGTLFVACLRPPGLDSLASCSRAFLGRPLLCCCDASSPSKSHSCWIFSPHVVLSTPLRSAAQESCLVLDRIHSAAYYSDIKTGRASACNTCPALTSSPVWRQTWLIITVPPIHPLNPTSTPRTLPARPWRPKQRFTPASAQTMARIRRCSC